MAVEKYNLEIYETDIFRQWHKTFHKQDSGKAIIRLLKDFTLKDPKKNSDWLKLHILVTCFFADKYKKEDDLGHQSREREKDRKKEIELQIKAIEKFIKLVEKDPYASRNFIFACSDLSRPKQKGFKNLKNRRKGQIIFKDIKDQIDTIFLEVLKNYKARLELELNYSEERFNQMLFTSGGLAFPQTQQGQTFRIQNICSNSFFFHMTYIFRHYTSQKLNLGDSLSQMPDIGEPHYHWTEKIHDNLFPNKPVDQKSIRKMVEHLILAHTVIHPWHTPLLPPIRS